MSDNCRVHYRAETFGVYKEDLVDAEGDVIKGDRSGAEMMLRERGGHRVVSVYDI